MSNPNPNPATRFQKGREPTGGRPKDARDRITRKYLLALADDFEEHGKAAIEKLRETDVGKYISAVGAVVPKEIEITRPLDGMSDGELTAAIQALTDAVRGQVTPSEDDQLQPTVN